MQWTSDPPREWTATWDPGWSLHVCRNAADSAWEWTVAYDAFKSTGDFGGVSAVRASMSGTAETPELCKRAAEEAADCLALAVREFAHHMIKRVPDGPPPF